MSGATAFDIADVVGRHDAVAAIDAAVMALATAPRDAALLRSLGAAYRGAAQASAAPGNVSYIGRREALKPARAVLHYHLAQALIAAGDDDSALHALDWALRCDPKHGPSHYLAGCLRRPAGAVTEAEAHFRAAAIADPRDPRALTDLGAALLDLGRPDEAFAVLDKAVELAPDLMPAVANLANALRDMGRPEDSIAYYDRAVALMPEHPEPWLNRAHALLLAGRLAEGFAAYEARRRRPGVGHRHGTLPEWDGGPLEGRTILVHAEQGIGDTIQFARYAKLLRDRGARVVLECQAKLAGLLAAQDLADHVVARGETPLSADLQVPLLSLPRLMGTTAEDVPARTPYVCAPRGRGFDLPPAPPATRLRVGLVWAGNPKHANDRNRSAPLSAFAGLQEIPGVALYSLQCGERAAEATPGSAIADLSPRLQDWTDTAAAISALDLVVSVDTAVAHLAGAMGKKCFVLLPFAPDWRWQLGRSDSPWYPSLTLFRPARPGNREGAVARLAEAVARAAAGHA